jgi:hypothetical protein
MTDCAAPKPDPFVLYIMQRDAQLRQRSAQISQRIAEVEKMPPGGEKDRALDQLSADNRRLIQDYHELSAEVDRERRTRAMESMARSQARMAEPTPYVVPTPIQVQIVPQ